MPRRDPFQSSLIALSSKHRLILVALLLGLLWLAIAWAVSLA